MERQKLNIHIVSDITKAEQLWRQFSPEETIYDSWEFRALFQKYHQKEIRFYCGYIGSVCIGCLPLQFNADLGHLEFFAGTYMEDNRLFITPGYEDYISDFYEYLKTCGEKVKLECIRGTDPFTTTLLLEDYKYILPLEGITNIEDYYQKYLKQEARGKFRRKVRIIEKEAVEIQENNLEDMELLFELNIDMFGADSAFMDRPHHKEIFRELSYLSCTTPHFLTFFVNGKKEAVSFSLLYNGCYEFFNVGVHMDGVKNMSTFMNIKNIERALAFGAHTVDAFVGSYSWKELFHFDKIPQYKFFVGIEER